MTFGAVLKLWFGLEFKLVRLDWVKSVFSCRAFLVDMCTIYKYFIHKKKIKIEFYGIIYIFKNYFVIVFSIFSNKQYSNRCMDNFLLLLLYFFLSFLYGVYGHAYLQIFDITFYCDATFEPYINDVIQCVSVC